MAFLAGKDASVMIGMDEYKFKVAKFSPKNQLGDVTNFTSAGFKEFIAGLTDAKITLSGPYDAGEMAFTVGDPYALILKPSGSISITVPTICEDIELSLDVEKPDEVNLTFQSTGSFTAAIT